jgi:hypothetical protein
VRTADATSAAHDGCRGALAEKTGSERTPAVYIRGQLVSGESLSRASKSGELSHWAEPAQPGAGGG